MERQIAVYWDFENIHAAVYENSGEVVKPYREMFFQTQPEAVNIAAIMEYVSSQGTVCLNRAFANWEPMKKYSRRLQEWSVDLIQLFPAGKSGKNGADIRLSIDIIEDMARLPHIDTIVLVAGDSDFLPVVRKVREKGRRIIGIAEQKSTNPNLVRSCHEFKFYSTLLSQYKSAAAPEATTGDTPRSGLSLPQAYELARAAMHRVMAQTGETYALKAALKPMMLRLDPSFDESAFQFASFSAFLKSCADWLLEEPGQADKLLRLKGRETGASVKPYAVPPPPVQALTPGQTAKPDESYRSILASSTSFRIPEPALLRKILSASSEMFWTRRDWTKADLLGELDQRLPDCGSATKRVYELMFKSRVFDRTPDGMLSVRDGYWDAGSLMTAVKTQAAARLLADASVKVNVAGLAKLFGDDHSDPQSLQAWDAILLRASEMNPDSTDPPEPGDNS